MFLAICSIGCGTYKQSVLLNSSPNSVLKEAAVGVQEMYKLSTLDKFSLRVYTKSGERIIDPDNYLNKGVSGSSQQALTPEKEQSFQIDISGSVKLPMIGEIKIAGLTMRESELLLEKEYAKFYENVFVKLRCESHRVVVLGSTGGLVVPLEFNNITVAEVLALSKVLQLEGKAQSIRLIRGEDVFLLDFSTIEGYQKGNMFVLPGDVLYVEPVRRPFIEGLRDYGPIISILTSIVAVVLFAVQ